MISLKNFKKTASTTHEPEEMMGTKDLVTGFTKYLNKQPKLYLFALGFINVLFVGAIDYKTGNEISLSIFYLLPIFFTVLFINTNAGVFISVVSSAIEFVANFLAGRTYSHPLIFIWNSGMLLGFFLLSVFILSTLKTEYKRRMELIDELSDTVAELKSTKEDLEQKSKDLARSNIELEQFASSVSHDLKEPLLAITIDLKLLMKRYEGKLDPEANKFISEAIDEAMQMQKLISDTLSYSRVDAYYRPFVLTDCNAILKRSLSNLRLPIEQSGAVVTHDVLPEVMADPIQLSQLLQNLIGNAIKFCNKEKPLIHISSKQKQKEWVFSVSDNGIGIPEEYRERIFQIFQRLHNKKEYPGSGIGLATCKKIVERHGGRIWIKSETGKGSTFFFTIPYCSV
jgi:signal transduction histidine kinase